MSHEEAVAIDTKLAELWEQADNLLRTMSNHKNYLASLVLSREERRMEKVVTLSELCERIATFADAYTKNQFSTYLAKYEEAKAQRQVALDTAAPLEAIYELHRWSRFFIVKNNNGHIHSSMNCSTCFHDTQFGWLPSLSGLTEAEAVADQGSILCTICYPSAPVEWTNGISKVAQTEKDERAAAKAKRDEAKAEKAITNPDGSTIREPGQWGGEIKTLVSARRALLEQFKNREYYGDADQVRYEFAVMLARAINHKTGEDIEELLIQAEYKAQKIVKKERGY